MLTPYILLILCFLLAGTNTSFAQLSAEQQQQRQELRKLSDEQRRQKARKRAESEAKKLKKEKWQSEEWSPSIVDQLRNLYIMQMEYNENLQPKHFIGEAKAVGSDKMAARTQALKLAKENLSEQIRNEMKAYPTDSNEKIFSQSRLRSTVAVEMYRTLPTKEIEAWISVDFKAESSSIH